jgi:pyruvate kinase
MKRDRRVKILATLGPSSSDPQTIEKLYTAGADVFRINMSHTDHPRLHALVAMIREIETKIGRPIGILADLQGPKLRVGTFEGDAVMLENGASFTLDSDKTPGNASRVHLPHREILQALEPGHRLLLDDGKIRLRVTSCTKTSADTVVEVGGKLSNRKGVSVPDTEIPVGALTDKDRKDLDAALEAGVDWIALSFIQRPDDLADVRKVTRGRAGILAKIEKPQAIERLSEIIDLSDALMVARGDLGVEMPLEQVPGLQKQIVRACRRAGKPVVVATQMLESMITAPAPTRAEVSDVATAVYDGADAVMLSAESAAGKYPVDSVTMMNRIIERVERDDLYRTILDAVHGTPDATGQDAITAAARQVAETIGAAAIVTYTTSGSTTLRASRERPPVPILCLTASLATARRLVIAWGVHSVPMRDVRSFSEMVQSAQTVALREGVARKDDKIVITAGVPFGTPGATNVLRIARV